MREREVTMIPHFWFQHWKNGVAARGDEQEYRRRSGLDVLRLSCLFIGQFEAIVGKSGWNSGGRSDWRFKLQSHKYVDDIQS